MTRLVCLLAISIAVATGGHARHAHHVAVPPSMLTVGGLQFAVPTGWQTRPAESDARAGEWFVPAPATQAADPVEIVAFFFGPNIGGSVKENIDGWSAAMTTPDGHPATATLQKRTVNGHAVTEVLLTGTYARETLQAGLPPQPKPGYALLGVAIENPGGTIFWRATGPAAQLAAVAPILDRMIDGLKPQPPAVVPSAP